MGIGGIGIWQLLIILVIVLLLFGTKKLKNLGGDLGGAIKGFKKAVDEEKADPTVTTTATEEIGTHAQAGKTAGKTGETAAKSAATKNDNKPS